jgi:lambda family phage portal protein
VNVLDRAIAGVAPVWGARRAAARLAISKLNGSGYDGASVGRRAGSWFASRGSANAVIRSGLPQLRARSRDIMRNTWWGARIKRTVKAHAIGYGITPVFKTSNKSLNRKLSDLWNEWAVNSTQSDAEGQLNINGLFALACDCTVESGETLFRINTVQPTGRRRIPIEVQLLEPDHLSPDRDGVLSAVAGGEVVVDQGIEYDRNGKRRAYYIYPDHPGDIVSGLRRSAMRVEADDIFHLYRKDRIGQGRGVPWVAPVILKGRDIADLEEAVVVKARIEACLTAFVKTNDSARTLAGSASTDTGTRRRIETLSPGAIIYGESGEEVSAITPSSSLSFESVLRSAWLTLAAGSGITYDQLTGDFGQANFSSLKAGKIEFRRDIEQFQWLCLAPMLLNPICSRFIDAAQDMGLAPRRTNGFYRWEWIMPAWEPIDPLKELQADILAVRSGRLTWAQFVAGWGFDPVTQLDEIEQWMRELDRRSIVLDTDPRRAAKGIKGAPKTASTSQPPPQQEQAQEETA